MKIWFRNISARRGRAIGPSVAVIVGLLVAACATPAQIENMQVSRGDNEHRASGALADSVTVTEVTGGDETNPLWVSRVGNQEFAEALRNSLRSNGFLSPEGKSQRYALTANLIRLDQPLVGLDLTVTSSVKYRVTETGTGRVVFDDIISASHTATVGDSLIAVQRLRFANEGSIRNNISKLLVRLAQIQGNAAAGQS